MVHIHTKQSLTFENLTNKQKYFTWVTIPLIDKLLQPLIKPPKDLYTSIK